MHIKLFARRKSTQANQCALHNIWQ